MKTRISLLLLIIVSVFSFWGCPKQTDVSSTAEPKQEETPTAATEGQKPEQKPEAAPAEEAKPTAQEESKERAATGASGLQPVYLISTGRLSGMTPGQ